jgi:hypothetical protein
LALLDLRIRLAMTARRVLSRAGVVGFVVGHRHSLGTPVQGPFHLFGIPVWSLANPSPGLTVWLLLWH